MKRNSDEERRREARRSRSFGRDKLEQELVRRDRARHGLPTWSVARKIDRQRKSMVQKDVFLTWREIGDAAGLWREFRDLTTFDNLQLLVDEASQYARYWIEAWESDHGRKIDEEGLSEIDTQFTWALEAHYAPKNYLRGRPLDQVVDLLNDFGATGMQMNIYEEDEDRARGFGTGVAIEVLKLDDFRDGEFGVLFRLYPPFVVAWAEAVYWYSSATYSGETLKDMGPPQVFSAIRGVLSSVGHRVRFNSLRDFYLDGEFEEAAEEAAEKHSSPIEEDEDA